MRKVRVVTQLIERRIANADHVLTGLPSERRLAEELGLSRTTVRSAMQILEDQGVLIRTPNGRLGVGQRDRDSKIRNKVIGFVTPVGASIDHKIWHDGVVGALEGHPVTLRWVTYAHWGDAALTEAIAGFDGLFFIPASQQIPQWLVGRMHDTKCRAVVLDQDETAAGLPSVGIFPPTAERKLFDHLVELGHRRIDCIVVQEGEDANDTPNGTRGRIAVWKQYLEENNLTGQLRSLIIRQPLEAGYRLIRDALAEGRPLASALFCTTGPAAIGAMRAIYEAGLEVGRDISVCAVNDEGLGPYLMRTLTSLKSLPRARYLQKAVDWILGQEQWEGPLLIQPDDVPLYEGESTGPAPASSVIVLNNQG